jgi:diguanylate cyclase (GGDEF)-like protein
MRHSTSANNKRAKQAPVEQQPLGVPFPEGPGGGELCLITRDAVARTGALTGLLVVWSAAETQLEVLCACGTDPRMDRLSLPEEWSGFAGRVLESGHAAGEPIDSDQDPHLACAASGARAGYAAGAPVRPPGHLRGALCVGLPDAPPDPATTRWVIESYARLAALCLSDRRALDGLLAAARLDPLTGCLNYAALRGELSREIGRCARHGRTLSCCFIDMDRFKQINDDHGHPQGNRVLADIGTALRAGVRAGDSVGRYGGDEFIVLLPDTDRRAAAVLASRLRARIGGCVVNNGHEPLDASIGVAQWQIGMTTEELLVAADEALRTAKHAGGGAVVTTGGVAARNGRDAPGAAA